MVVEGHTRTGHFPFSMFFLGRAALLTSSSVGVEFSQIRVASGGNTLGAEEAQAAIKLVLYVICRCS